MRKSIEKLLIEKKALEEKLRLAQIERMDKLAAALLTLGEEHPTLTLETIIGAVKHILEDASIEEKEHFYKTGVKFLKKNKLKIQELLLVKKNNAKNKQN